MLRPYIERRHFTLYTDYQALKWLLDTLNASLAPHLSRWRLRLQEFDNFTVRYRRSPDNQVADAITMLPMNGFEWHKTEFEVPCMIIDECGQQSTERLASMITKIDQDG